METRIFRCLRALKELSKSATCTEIAGATEHENREGSSVEGMERISPRHVNWVLKDVLELVRRSKVKGDVIRYQILPAGVAYIDAVQDK